MNIAQIGYGKMGRTIEKIAESRGHTIISKIDNSEELHKLSEVKPDVAIEFSSPESGYKNIKFCIENNIPIVSGTTGWLEKYSEISNLCLDKKSAFFYASNYSVGVNLFFE